MPRTRIQSKVDAEKLLELGKPLGETLVPASPSNLSNKLPSERTYPVNEGCVNETPKVQRLKKLPSSNLLVDLDTGIVYVDPVMLKVLQ
jgi:hypothetical protein